MGVEGLEQLRFLQGIGCNLGQGSLQADPVPAERIATLMREGIRLP